MEKDIYRSQFRLPQSLYEQLKAEADKNKRSVNAELVSRLEGSFSAVAPSPLKTKVVALLADNFDAIFERAVQEAIQNSIDAHLVSENETSKGRSS